MFRSGQGNFLTSIYIELGFFSFTDFVDLNYLELFFVLDLMGRRKHMSDWHQIMMLLM